MRVWVIISVVGSMLTGCASGVRSVPAPVSISPSVPKIGQIDDDRESEASENPIISVLLLPVRGVEALISIPVSQMKYIEGDTPLRAARMTTDQSSPDNRRDGIYKLAGYRFTHRPPYTTHYEQMAQSDADPSVRAAALRACNISRDAKATPIFIGALSDTSEMVRLEAAKGLCNLPDPNAVPSLLRVAGNPDESRDVRIAATDALKYYRTQEVGRTLVTILIDRDFSLAFQAHRSLIYLTHKDFGFDQSPWLGYFAGPEKPLG